MDWDTYKELSHSPEYFTRWALDRTTPHLDDRLRELLSKHTAKQPLEKPVDHKGGPETDILRVDLDLDSVQSIVDALSNARAQEKIETGSFQRNLNGIINSWEEYVDWRRHESN